MKIEESVCKTAHIAAGIVAGLSSQLYNGWALTICITGLFALYEIVERNELGAMVWKDNAHEELSEFLLGLCLAVVMVVIVA